MRFTLFLTAAAAILAGAGVAAAPSSPMPASPMPAHDFVTAASQSDNFEIMSGRLALTQSQDARVRALAQQMIDDHTRTRAALAQAAMADNAGPPADGLNGDQQKMIQSLQSQSGAAFDRDFAKDQVMAHEAALTMMRSYAETGTAPHVRDAARAATPVVAHHLEMVRGMAQGSGAM